MVEPIFPNATDDWLPFFYYLKKLFYSDGSILYCKLPLMSSNPSHTYGQGQLILQFISPKIIQLNHCTNDIYEVFLYYKIPSINFCWTELNAHNTVDWLGVINSNKNQCKKRAKLNGWSFHTKKMENRRRQWVQRKWGTDWPQKNYHTLTLTQLRCFASTKFTLNVLLSICTYKNRISHTDERYHTRVWVSKCKKTSHLLAYCTGKNWIYNTDERDH